MAVADREPCTTDSCHPLGGCKHVSLADATTCSSGDKCTVHEKCVAGQCRGSPKVCPVTGLAACSFAECLPGGESHLWRSLFALACTANLLLFVIHSLIPISVGCKVRNTTAACSDPDFCIDMGQCSIGKCKGERSAASLPVNRPQSLVASSGDNLCSCLGKPDNAPCSDSNRCTSGDKCISQVCVAGTGRTNCDVSPISLVLSFCLRLGFTIRPVAAGQQRVHD